MRFLYRRAKYRTHELDTKVVEDVLSSDFFIFIDLFFWSLLMTLLTLSLHFSLLGACTIFISSYIFGASLHLFLRRWMKEPQN
ncbi:hypothetical protein ACFFHH_07690 [Cytobacillus solani]|uniref:Uncharacterized protein n=1 Tax=Cytobacillus solani TaxID=1637975 RepID=A0A0Q3T9Y0_9BACI|nr:hypothetical protein [Cytobacillus solani]KOP83131.1 hypothetical protein AMS60_12010 [Bacillus sp. FJAT-21945]KQL20157.1 hypothetical protein AN957_17320 [Cytobacillus solani]USK53407.1 hypothetical protein LIS82_17595 [Cytobacillus solani]